MGTVAIVDFSNLSQNPKDAWLGPALSEMLATEIGVDGKLQVIADELVRSARSDLAAPTAGGYAPQSLATLRKRLNASFVLSGGYLVAGTADAPQLRLDLSLQSTKDEKIHASFARNAAVAELPKLVADAGAQLRGELGIAEIEAQTLQLTANAQPPTAEVARRIGFALDALHRFDACACARRTARCGRTGAGLCTRLRVSRPVLVDVWATRPRRWLLRNKPQRMRKICRTSSVLQIDAQLHAAQFDWPKTVEAYRKLVELRPQNSDYRLQLIDALLAAASRSMRKAATDRIAQIARCERRCTCRTRLGENRRGSRR